MPRYFKESEINSLFDVSCKESFAICKIYLFCYHFNYSKKSWPTRIYAVALKKKTITGSESVLPSAGCTGRGSWSYFAGKNQGTSCQRDTRTSKKHLPWVGRRKLSALRSKRLLYRTSIQMDCNQYWSLRI